MDQIGLCVLLFRIGLETDLENARRVAVPASLLALVGMLLPLGLGTLGGTALGIAVLPALFIAATLTATSIGGATASLLEELAVGSGRAATPILGAAVVDDALGLALARGAEKSVG